MLWNIVTVGHGIDIVLVLWRSWTFLNAFFFWISMASNHHHLGDLSRAHPQHFIYPKWPDFDTYKTMMSFCFHHPSLCCLVTLKTMQVVAEKSWGIILFFIFINLLLIITMGSIHNCHLSLYESANNCIRAAFLLISG